MNTGTQQYRHHFPLLVMFALFIGMGLIAWFGIVPFQGFITEKADSIQEYYASRENRQRQIAKLPELQAQYESITADEETLHILLNEKKIVDFVKTLERLAQETRTQVAIQAKSKDVIEEKQTAKGGAKKAPSKVDADPDTPGAQDKAPATILESVPYDRYLHVNVVVTGQYRGVVSFLHKMETLAFGIDVIGLSVRVLDAEEISTKVSAPGNNPFSIFPQEAPTSGEGTDIVSTPPEAVTPVGSLEATFDTVVYLSKQE
ncbi:MAG: hypothetical protein Q8O53_01835 [Candidatus Moranbacteria bacterium]|nr:hypothetical protein [Candidatus Moranbacteria bacterium]